MYSHTFCSLPYMLTEQKALEDTVKLSQGLTYNCAVMNLSLMYIHKMNGIHENAHVWKMYNLFRPNHFKYEGFAASSLW